MTFVGAAYHLKLVAAPIFPSVSAIVTWILYNNLKQKGTEEETKSLV